MSTLPFDRRTVARQMAADLDDLQLGIVLLTAQSVLTIRLEGDALAEVLAGAFDDCALRSVAAGDIRPADSGTADAEETLFRWRWGARTVRRAFRGEGALFSAAHIGRLTRLALARGGA